MKRSRSLWSVAAAALVVFGVPASASAQAAQNPLPTEVQDWLARDQVQRWRVMLMEGDSIFNARSCARCHGTGGTDGNNGPDLTDSEWVQSDGSLEGIRETIFWGVRRQHLANPDFRFEMNPGGGIDLTWDQYSSLAAYVWSLSRAPAGGG